MNLLFVFPNPYGFKIVKTFTERNSRQYVALFVRSFRRQKHERRLANDFPRRIAKNLLRAAIPTGDDTIQRFADDGVIRGFDNTRQLRARFFSASTLQVDAMQQGRVEPDERAEHNDILNIEHRRLGLRTKQTGAIHLRFSPVKRERNQNYGQQQSTSNQTPSAFTDKQAH